MAKILVVDDEEIITKTFVRLLETRGYTVSVASSGEEALVKVEAEDFDLILSDIRMPGLSGIETVQRIQQLQEERQKPRVPVIFLTGYTDLALEQEAHRLNPSAYIYKPFDALKLLETVAATLEAKL